MEETALGTNGTPEKPDWVDRWLSVFRDTGNVRLACHAAGVGRTTAYMLRVRDPEFALAWKEAEEDACDLLEAEARSRARKTSDTLLIFLLKAHRPEKFRERFSIDMVLKRFEEMGDDELNGYLAERLFAALPSGADSAGDAAVQEREASTKAGGAAGGSDPVLSADTD